MPFRDLRDLLARIPLRDKEIKHLIQCGALDGMGENRMTMLHHAERISRSGNARQLAFDFTDHVYAPTHSAAAIGMGEIMPVVIHLPHSPRYLKRCIMPKMRQRTGITSGPIPQQPGRHALVHSPRGYQAGLVGAVSICGMAAHGY